MTAILATCDVCGPVELTPEEVVIVGAHGLDHPTHYAFICCSGVQIRPANRKTVEVLTAAGVQRIQ